MFCLYNIDKASNDESVCHWNLHLPKTSKKKRVSVSLAPVGFTHAKLSASFRFSINYILWFHTWQCIQYRERFNKAVWTKTLLTNCYRMEPLLHHTNEGETTRKGNTIRNCKDFIWETGICMEKPKMPHYNPWQLTVQHASKNVFPVKIQLPRLLFLNLSRSFLHTFNASNWATVNESTNTNTQEMKLPLPPKTNDPLRFVKVKGHSWTLQHVDLRGVSCTCTLQWPNKCALKRGYVYKLGTQSIRSVHLQWTE